MPTPASSNNTKNTPDLTANLKTKTYKISSWFHNCGVSAIIPHLIHLIAPKIINSSSFTEKPVNFWQLNQLSKQHGFKLFKKTFLEYYRLTNNNLDFTNTLEKLFAEFNNPVDQTIILSPVLRIMLGKVLLKDKTFKKNLWEQYIVTLNNLYDICNNQNNIKNIEKIIKQYQTQQQDDILCKENISEIAKIITQAINQKQSPTQLIGSEAPLPSYETEWNNIYKNYCSYIGSMEHHPFLSAEHIAILANQFGIYTKFLNNKNSNQFFAVTNKPTPCLKSIKLVNQNDLHWELEKTKRRSKWDSETLTKETKLHGIFSIAKRKNYQKCNNLLTISKKIIKNYIIENKPYKDEYLFVVKATFTGKSSMIEGLSQKITKSLTSLNDSQANIIYSTDGFQKFINTFEYYYEVNLGEEKLIKLKFLLNSYQHPIERNFILEPILIRMLDEYQANNSSQNITDSLTQLYNGFRLNLTIYNKSNSQDIEILKEDYLSENKVNNPIDTVYLATDGSNWNELINDRIDAVKKNAIIQNRHHLHFAIPDDSKELIEYFPKLKKGITQFLNTKKLFTDIAQDVPNSNIYKTPEPYLDLSDNTLNKILEENITWLSNQGFTKHTQWQNNNTLLHIAASYNKPKIIEYCLNHLKIDIESKNSNNETPLLIAAKHGAKDAIKILLNRNAAINCKDNENFNFCHALALHGDTQNFKIAMEIAKAKTQQKNILAKFFTSEFNINQETYNWRYKPFKDKNWGAFYCWAPIHFASFFGHHDFIELLLENGAYIDHVAYYKNPTFSTDQQNDFGKITPLTLAVSTDNTKMIDSLLRWYEEGKGKFVLTDRSVGNPSIVYDYAVACNNINAILRLSSKDSLKGSDPEFSSFASHLNNMALDVLASTSNGGIYNLFKPDNKRNTILHHLAAITESYERDSFTSLVMAKLFELRKIQSQSITVSGYSDIFLKNSNKQTFLDIAVKNNNHNWLSIIKNYLEMPIENIDIQGTNWLFRKYQSYIDTFNIELSKIILPLIKSGSSKKIAELIKIKPEIGFMPGEYNIFHYANNINKLDVIFNAYSQYQDLPENDKKTFQYFAMMFADAQDIIGRTLAYRLKKHPDYQELFNPNPSYSNIIGSFFNHIGDSISCSTQIEHDLRKSYVYNAYIIAKPVVNLSVNLYFLGPLNTSIKYTASVFCDKFGLDIQYYAGSAVGYSVRFVGDVACDNLPNIPYHTANFASQMVYGEPSYRFDGLGETIAEFSANNIQNFITHGPNLISLTLTPKATIKNYLFNVLSNNVISSIFPNSPNIHAAAKIVSNIAIMGIKNDAINKDKLFYDKVEFNLRKLLSAKLAKLLTESLKTPDNIKTQLAEYINQSHNWISQQIPDFSIKLNDSQIIDNMPSGPDDNPPSGLMQQGNDFLQKAQQTAQSMQFKLQDFSTQLEETIEKIILNQMDPSSDFVKESHARIAHEHVATLYARNATSELIDEAVEKYNTLYEQTDAHTVMTEAQEALNEVFKCEIELQELLNKKKPDESDINKKQEELTTLKQKEKILFEKCQLVNSPSITDAYTLSKENNTEALQKGLTNMVNLKTFDDDIDKIVHDAVAKGNGNYTKITDIIVDQVMIMKDPFGVLTKEEYTEQRDKLFEDIYKQADKYLDRRIATDHYTRKFYRKSKDIISLSVIDQHFEGRHDGCIRAGNSFINFLSSASSDGGNGNNQTLLNFNTNLNNFSVNIQPIQNQRPIVIYSNDNSNGYKVGDYVSNLSLAPQMNYVTQMQANQPRSVVFIDQSNSLNYANLSSHPVAFTQNHQMTLQNMDIALQRSGFFVESRFYPNYQQSMFNQTEHTNIVSSEQLLSPTSNENFKVADEPKPLPANKTGFIGQGISNPINFEILKTQAITTTLKNVIKSFINLVKLAIVDTHMVKLSLMDKDNKLINSVPMLKTQQEKSFERVKAFTDGIDALKNNPSDTIQALFNYAKDEHIEQFNNFINHLENENYNAAGVALGEVLTLAIDDVSLLIGGAGVVKQSAKMTQKVGNNLARIASETTHGVSRVTKNISQDLSHTKNLLKSSTKDVITLQQIRIGLQTLKSDVARLSTEFFKPMNPHNMGPNLNTPAFNLAREARNNSYVAQTQQLNNINRPKITTPTATNQPQPVLNMFKKRHNNADELARVSAKNAKVGGNNSGVVGGGGWPNKHVRNDLNVSQYEQQHSLNKVNKTHSEIIDDKYALNQIPIKHNFSNKSELIKHFDKHAQEFKGVYSNPEEYLRGANFVIENGHKVIYTYNGNNRTGYVRFMGNSSNISVDQLIANLTKKELGLPKDHKFGEAKFEFLAIREDGTIATYHTQSGRKFYKTINGSKKADDINVKELSCKIM